MDWAKCPAVAWEGKNKYSLGADTFSVLGIDQRAPNPTTFLQTSDVEQLVVLDKTVGIASFAIK